MAAAALLQQHGSNILYFLENGELVNGSTKVSSLLRHKAMKMTFVIVFRR